MYLIFFSFVIMVFCVCFHPVLPFCGAYLRFIPPHPVMLYQPSGILDSVYQRAGLESICKIRIINEFYYEKEAAKYAASKFYSLS